MLEGITIAIAPFLFHADAIRSGLYRLLTRFISLLALLLLLFRSRGLEVLLILEPSFCALVAIVLVLRATRDIAIHAIQRLDVVSLSLKQLVLTRAGIALYERDGVVPTV